MIEQRSLTTDREWVSRVRKLTHIQDYGANYRSNGCEDIVCERLESVLDSWMFINLTNPKLMMDTYIRKIIHLKLKGELNP